MLDHMDKEVLKKWLKAGYMEIERSTEAGTPQGGMPTLANLTLDRLLKETFRPRKIVESYSIQR